METITLLELENALRHMRATGCLDTTPIMIYNTNKKGTRKWCVRGAKVHWVQPLSGWGTCLHTIRQIELVIEE